MGVKAQVKDSSFKGREGVEASKDKLMIEVSMFPVHRISHSGQ